MNFQKPWWNPNEFSQKRPKLEQRARIYQAIRTYFLSQDFLEVETPALQVSPGLETHLMAFATVQENPFGQPARELFLHTSPEFAMKKLLVAGLPRIYQLARVYRNRERSSTHHPEFTMLEWYRSTEPYTRIMTDVEELLLACAGAVPEQKTFTWQGVACDLRQSAERLSVCEAFQRYAGFDLLQTIDDHENPGASRLAQEAKRQGLHSASDDTWEDLFFRFVLEKVEPHLGQGRVTILYDYPISLAALSRPKKEDPRLAERFEVYAAGLELANAFGELTNARVQRTRFERDRAKKEKLYGFSYPIDEDFMQALDFGLPESSGIALGVDRLVMLLTGAQSVEEVLWAPVAGESF